MLIALGIWLVKGKLQVAFANMLRDTAVLEILQHIAIDSQAWTKKIICPWSRDI